MILKEHFSNKVYFIDMVNYSNLWLTKKLKYQNISCLKFYLENSEKMC